MNTKSEVIFIKKIVVIVFVMLLSFLTFNYRKIEAYGFGFSRNSEHQVPNIGFYKKILEENNGYYVGEPNCVYLTFDVGYDNGYLEKYLDILKEENVKATFFVTGDFVRRFSSLLVRIHEEGHLICNHSYSHRNINSLSNSELERDLTKLENAYYDVIGVKMAKIFRPPEGQFDEKSLKFLSKLGYKTIFWSIAHVDWKNSKDNSYKNIVDNIHDGAVVLLHTVNEDNYQNLSNIIKFIRDNGYELATVDKIKQKKVS